MVMVVAPTFGAVFQAAFWEHLKKLLKPEEMAPSSVTDDANVQRDRLERALVQVRPTALIAITVRPDPHTVAAYTAARVPIVLIDEESPGASTVTADNFKGGRLAGEYLVSKGRKRIAVVSGRTQVTGGYNAEQRLRGFQQALAAARLSIPPGCAVEVLHYTREDGIEVMPTLLDRGVDAVFCAAGDYCAVGLLTVARERGLRIPEEIAIVGFDDLLVARLSIPRLTTIKQPLEKMAQSACTMAVTNGDRTLHLPQKVVFDPELVIRQSA
jgi:DNA-binding LacI/PurR family transcriptional regulator